MVENLQHKISLIVDQTIIRKGFRSSDYTSSDDLMRKGVLDSIDVVEILTAIDQSLGVKVKIDASNDIISKDWFSNVD